MTCGALSLPWQYLGRWMPRSGCTSHCGAPRCQWWSPPLWWRSASKRWCQGNSCTNGAAMENRALTKLLLRHKNLRVLYQVQNRPQNWADAFLTQYVNIIDRITVMWLPGRQLAVDFWLQIYVTLGNLFYFCCHTYNALLYALCCFACVFDKPNIPNSCHLH